ncbi:MAG TPA: hypothetical protein VIR57_08385, partial [Chloroflexota bacterium]
MKWFTAPGGWGELPTLRAEATALMVMAPTAWHLLIDRAQLRAGESVLILAAGGGLGTMGVQIAKLAGARVIA